MSKNRTFTSATPMPDLDVVPMAYRQDVEDLFDRWQALRTRNATLTGYVEMRQRVHDLGISIPPQLLNVNVAVGWADKAVRVRSVRSKFDGFVFEGNQDRSLDALVKRNRLLTKYSLACKGALTHGVSAMTVMRGNGRRQPPVMVRAFSANQCCMLWDKDVDGVGCGIVVAEVNREGIATRYVLHEPDAVVTLALEDSDAWSCSVEPHKMGRPLIEPLVHDPDADRPLGHSVITPEVMGIIDKAMRDVLRMEVGAEFFTAPQRYILGADERLFDLDTGADEGSGSDDDDDDDESTGSTVDHNKMIKAYLGMFLAISRDANGDVPQVGQFPAGDAGNFIAVFENDAQRFSGATNVPLGQLGVLSNTYTSSDALGAANDPLILDVEQFNAINSEALEEVARMMMAVRDDKRYDELSDYQMLVQASFQDPSQPTLAARADGWTKIAAVDNSLIGTRVWYEGLGLRQATIDRIMAGQSQATSLSMMQEIASALASTEADNG